MLAPTHGVSRFVSPREIFGERIAHGLKARAHMPFDTDA